jgi:hypothetical protein
MEVAVAYSRNISSPALSRLLLLPLTVITTIIQESHRRHRNSHLVRSGSTESETRASSVSVAVHLLRLPLPKNNSPASPLTPVAHPPPPPLPLQIATVSAQTRLTQTPTTTLHHLPATSHPNRPPARKKNSSSSTSWLHSALSSASPQSCYYASIFGNDTCRNKDGTFLGHARIKSISWGP